MSITDTFTGAAGDLAAHTADDASTWSYIGGAGTFQLDGSGKLLPTDPGGWTFAIDSNVQSTPDIPCRIKLTFQDRTHSFVGLLSRIDGSGNGYFALWGTPDGSHLAFTVFLVVAGALGSQIGGWQGSAVDPAPGTDLWMEFAPVGTSIEINSSSDGVTFANVYTQTDATYSAAGKTGLGCDGTSANSSQGVIADDFQFGTSVAPFDYIYLDNANLYLTDNWLVSGSPAGAATIYPGAGIKGAFANTTRIRYFLDMSPEVTDSIPDNYNSTLLIGADGLVPASTQPTTGQAYIDAILDSTRTSHYSELRVQKRDYTNMFLNQSDYWSANGSGYPPIAVRIAKIGVDIGGTCVTLTGTPLQPKPKRVRIYGDSKAEGYAAMGLNAFETLASWGFVFGLVLDGEVTMQAFAGTSYQATAQGSIPVFGTYWSELWGGQTILDGSSHFRQPPDFVVIDYTNDVHIGALPSMATLATWAAIRTAMNSATTPLVIVMPDVAYARTNVNVQYPGPLQSSIRSIFATYHGTDPASYLDDEGEDEAAGTNFGSGPGNLWAFDSYHPSAVCHVHRGARRAQNLLAQLPGGGKGILTNPGFSGI